MATPRTASTSSLELDRAKLRERVEGDLGRLKGLRELLEELELYEDLDAELGECMPPTEVAPSPTRKVRRELGLRFDVEEVRRVLEFCLLLRHVKGRWSGSRLVPDLWQVIYVIAPVFGWRRRDGNRLYRTLYLEVPRKNGKSTLAAALVLFLLMADSNLKAGRRFEPGAEVYSAASTTDQARMVFRPAETMARRSPRIARALSIHKDRALIFERAVSRYEVLSGDPKVAEEKMGLNASGITIDELHTAKDRRLVDTLESSTGAREQPLIVIITTAGDDDEGSIYDEKRTYAEKVAEGDIVDPTFYGAIYAVPEGDALAERWDDLEVIRRVNPGYGRSVSEDYFLEQLPKARASEAKRLSFCRLHLNLRTGSLSRYISVADWTASGAFVDPELDELAGMDAYAGLDLASSTDLAAATFLVPRWDADPEDSRYEVEVLDVVLRAWVPLGSLERRKPSERALFSKWLEEGYLIGHPGETLDYDLLEEDVLDVAAWLSVQRLHFDRWGSKQLVGRLRKRGLNVVEMGQGFASMSSPTKSLERIVLERRLRHRRNPVLRYAIGNLIVRQDPAGNLKPDRGASAKRGRIDPGVSTIMAIDAYERETEPQESAYTDRGVFTA